MSRHLSEEGEVRAVKSWYREGTDLLGMGKDPAARNKAPLCNYSFEA